MFEKTVILVTVVAFAASVFAFEWKECPTSVGQSPRSAVIKFVNVTDCDPNIKGACGLKDNTEFQIDVDFVPSLTLENPVIAFKFPEGNSKALLAFDCVYGLRCPGQPGQEQHLRHITIMDRYYYPQDRDVFNANLYVREKYGDASDVICIEFPVKVLRK